MERVVIGGREVVTVDRVAELLGVTHRHAINLIEAGLLEDTRIGKRRFVFVDTLLPLKAKREVRKRQLDIKYGRNGGAA